VFLYEHGARVYRVEPFSCPFDSGQVGFVCSEEEGAEIERALAGEVAAYGSWAEGEIYRWTIYNDDGDDVDSCGGYYCEERADEDGRSAILPYLLEEDERAAEIEGHNADVAELLCLNA